MPVVTRPSRFYRAYSTPDVSPVHRPERDPSPLPTTALGSYSPMTIESTIAPLIAVVDDEDSVRRSLARFLKASGFQSVIYPSAEAFLADKQYPGFDCLIVDLQLGGISGTELQDRLISAGVNIPMILMTARDEKELDRLALQAQGVALLRKSDPGVALLATLHRVMHRYRHQEKGRRNGRNA